MGTVTQTICINNICASTLPVTMLVWKLSKTESILRLELMKEINNMILLREAEEELGL